MNREMRALSPGYTSEVDRIDEQSWYKLLDGFSDANIYQTWAYAEVISGLRKMSHLVLKRDGVVVAIAQARIANLPVTNLGVAYIHWGPLYKLSNAESDAEIFRQAIRALRNEFVCKRGLVLRIFPVLFNEEMQNLSTLLSEESFAPVSSQSPGKTLIMSLVPGIEELRQTMKPHWLRELKVAEKKNLHVTDGTGDDLFATFTDMYKEMVSRKKFVEPNDINQFRSIQKRLPDSLKMKILLCSTNQETCAGAICSAIGGSAIYLFGATSNAGMKSRGSYLLQWKFVEQLKAQGIASYDLNGINPATNPGTYKFKSDLASKHGKEVSYLGRFDSHPSRLAHFCIELADRLRNTQRSLKQQLKNRFAGKAPANIPENTSQAGNAGAVEARTAVSDTASSCSTVPTLREAQSE